MRYTIYHTIDAIELSTFVTLQQIHAAAKQLREKHHDLNIKDNDLIIRYDDHTQVFWLDMDHVNEKTE